MTASPLNASLVALRDLADDPDSADPEVVRDLLRVARRAGVDAHRLASDYAGRAFGPELLDLLLPELHPEARGQRLWPLLRGMPEEIEAARRVRALAWRRWDREVAALRAPLLAAADVRAVLALERVDEVTRAWLVGDEGHRDASAWLLREAALTEAHRWGERWGLRLMRRVARGRPELDHLISQLSVFEGLLPAVETPHPDHPREDCWEVREDAATFRVLHPATGGPVVLRCFPVGEEPAAGWVEGLSAWTQLTGPGFALLYSHAALPGGFASLYRQSIEDGVSLQGLAESRLPWEDPAWEGSIAEIGLQVVGLLREAIALTGLRHAGLHPRNVFVRSSGRIALLDPVGAPLRWPAEPPAERALVCAIVALLAELQADLHGELGVVVRGAWADTTVGLALLEGLLEPIATGPALLGARIFLP